MNKPVQETGFQKPRQYWINNAMNTHTLSISSQPSDATLRMTGRFVVSFAAFAAIGLAVAVTLSGIGKTPTNEPAAYFNHGQTITIGGQSLDLSKMIFISGEVCLNEDSIAGSSSLGPRGCSLADSRVPTSVIAIAANGLEAPFFKVEVDTTEGTTEGWVGLNNLRN